MYRYKCNAHGDVVALLDESGQTVNSYSYDIFGKSLRTEERIPNPIRYAHEYFDGESGMYYLRGRYYDPSMRRFTTPDPAEDGINHYAYCGNNPFMNIDPSGYAVFVNQSFLKLELWVSGNELRDLEDYFRGYSDGIKDVMCQALGLSLQKLNPYLASAINFGGGYVFDKCSPNLSRADVCKKAQRDGRGIHATLLYNMSGEDVYIALDDISAQEVEDYASGRRRPN